MIDALETLVGSNSSNAHVRRIRLSELVTGMVVASDIRTVDGSTLLVLKGQELSEMLLQRIHNFNRHSPVSDRIEVVLPQNQEEVLSPA